MRGWSVGTAPRSGLSPSAETPAQLPPRALPLAPDLLQRRVGVKGTGGHGSIRHVARAGQSHGAAAGASNGLSAISCQFQGQASHLAPAAYHQGQRSPRKGSVSS